MPRLTLRADVGVGAIAVSPNSRDVVLAGRPGLYVVDLGDPFALPRWLPLSGIWEVASIQWSSHKARHSQLVSTSNQKAVVWNLELPSSQAVEHVLHGHRRAVSDVDFSPFHPDILATASIDTTVRLWDIRQPQSEILTFADFAAGATRLKFSPVDEAQFSSAHNKRIVTWDKRWANCPVANWEAHSGECNGLEYLANGKLLTCSTDKTIKVWDSLDGSGGVGSRESQSSNRCELTIKSDFPILRAIPTPYELGAIIVPLRGGDDSAYLLNLSGQTGEKTVNDLTLGQFNHSEPVKSAVFMRSDQNPGHYNVLTWCQDSQLREFDGSVLYSLPHASSAAGCKDDTPPPLPKDATSFNTTRYDSGELTGNHNFFDIDVFNERRDLQPNISHVSWIDGVRFDQEDRRNGTPSKSIRQHKLSSEELSREIISVSSHMPKVEFKDINIGLGSCEIYLQGPWGINDEIVPISVFVKVHEDYPYEPMYCQIIDELGAINRGLKDHGLSKDAKDSASKAPDSTNTSVDPAKTEGNVSEDNDGVKTNDNHLIKSVLSPFHTPISKINKTLNESCVELSRHGVYALEFCVRYLVGDPVSIEDALANNQNLEWDDVDLEILELDRLVNSEILDQSNLGDDFVQFEPRMTDSSDEDDKEDSSLEIVAKEPTIDSTPLPKNCGAVWSPTGKLVCFFNYKPPSKEKVPLPLDKIFAEDAKDEDSNGHFVSDDDEFERDVKSALLPKFNWSVTAAQLTGNVQAGIQRDRSRTVTTAPSEEGANGDSAIVGDTLSQARVTNSVVIKDLIHMWPCRPDLAAEYLVDMHANPLTMVEHNAEVAKKHGLSDDEYIWRLLHAYIKIEIEECSHPYASLISENNKFDWEGGRSGLSSLLPKVVDDLEAKGNIQLLVCMSSVMTALRTFRNSIKKSAPQYNAWNETGITVIDLRQDCSFRLNKDGTMGAAMRRENECIGRDFGVKRDSTDSEMSRSESLSIKSTAESVNWPEKSGSPGSEKTVLPKINLPGYRMRDRQGKNEAVPHVSIEICGSLMFEYDCPPQPETVYVGAKSDSDDLFLRWLPRLVNYRLNYARLLTVWGLDIHRVEVLKYSRRDPLIRQRMAAFNQWDHGHAIVDVETKAIICAFCNTPIVKLFEHCVACSHAMHSHCAKEWWQYEQECPQGCGCQCKYEVDFAVSIDPSS